MKKPEEVYLGRRDSGDGLYEIATTKARWDTKRGFDLIDMLRHFCPDDFERVTGIHLEPGEVRRVSINIELLD